MIKPSELPENTVISDADLGYFFKDTKGTWREISQADNRRPDLVKDCGHPNRKNTPSNFIETKSDDYFKDFEIVSTPVGWIHPDIDHEVVYWYDLAKLRAVRKTTIHEVIEDDGSLKEEDLATAKATLPVWRDIPWHPNYETASKPYGNDIYVRTKKTKNYKQRNNSGFFVLYEKGKRVWWCEGELGTSNQIDHFYKTGEVGADV